MIVSVINPTRFSPQRKYIATHVKSLLVKIQLKQRPPSYNKFRKRNHLSIRRRLLEDTEKRTTTYSICETRWCQQIRLCGDTAAQAKPSIRERSVKYPKRKVNPLNHTVYRLSSMLARPSQSLQLVQCCLVPFQGAATSLMGVDESFRQQRQISQTLNRRDPGCSLGVRMNVREEVFQNGHKTHLTVRELFSRVRELDVERVAKFFPTPVRSLPARLYCMEQTSPPIRSTLDIFPDLVSRSASLCINQHACAKGAAAAVTSRAESHTFSAGTGAKALKRPLYMELASSWILRAAISCPAIRKIWAYFRFISITLIAIAVRLSAAKQCLKPPPQAKVLVVYYSALKTSYPNSVSFFLRVRRAH